jgi:acetyl-CoA acyltransferase
MRDIAVVQYARSPLGKARKGSLAQVRPDDLAASTLRGMMAKVPGLELGDVDDIIVGCAMPEGEQGLNIARTVGFLSGFPDSVPAMTLNRFCSSGLEAIAEGSAKIGMGWQRAVVAGGVESMSMVPMGGFKLSPNPTLMEERPAALTSMGITAEIVAERFGISREDQDAYSVQSHLRAARAQDEGRFHREIVPY